jgi:hypothetical protein
MNFKNIVLLIMFLGNHYLTSQASEQEFEENQQHNMPITLTLTKKNNRFSFLASSEIAHDTYFMGAKKYCTTLTSIKDIMEAIDYIDLYIATSDGTNIFFKTFGIVGVVGVFGFYIAIIRDVTWGAKEKEWVPHYLKLWSLAAIATPCITVIEELSFNAVYRERLQELRNLLLQQIATTHEISTT